MTWTAWFRQEAAGRILALLSPLLYWAAFIWRSLLRRTCFVAVTGSFGKTTVKELLSEALAARHRTFRSHSTQNAKSLLALNLLRVRPWHRFAVLEVGISRPGQMKPAARLVRPDVAVIIGIGGAHTSSFRSPEEVAADKLELLGAIRPGGTAVINGDEPTLAGAGKRENLRILRFGAFPEADLRGSEVHADWPGRLTLTVSDRSGSLRVATRLVGTHWAPSVMAALQAARGCGLELAEATQAIEMVKPFPARMQPIRLPGGATCIRDEYNSEEDSYRESFSLFAAATADRKILITSDYDSRLKRRRRLRRLGMLSAAVADIMIFVGECSEYARRGAVEAGAAPDSAHSFTTPRDAARWLDGRLGAGDLVLLEGRSCDHLSRVLFAQVGEVRCWKTTCPKRYLCDVCWQLGTPKEALSRIEQL